MASRLLVTWVEGGAANFEMHGGATFGKSFGDQVWGINAGSSLSSRPTITYTPIEGNTFVKQLLGEIDPSTFVLLFRSGWPIQTLCQVSLGYPLMGVGAYFRDRDLSHNYYQDSPSHLERERASESPLRASWGCLWASNP